MNFDQIVPVDSSEEEVEETRIIELILSTNTERSRGRRIKLDLSDFVQDARARRWMFIKEESFSTISDVVEKLREEYHELGEDDMVSLILDNFSLPPWETVDLLQFGDLIKVTRSQPRPSETQTQRVNRVPPQADWSLEDLLLPLSDDESDETLDQLDTRDQSDPVDDEEDKERDARLGTRGIVKSDADFEDVIERLQEQEMEDKKMHSGSGSDTDQRQRMFLINFGLRPIKDRETTSKKQKKESTNIRPRKSGRIAQKKSHL